MPRDFDLVVLGATGSVGKAMSAYLAENAPPGLRWGLCGRAKSRGSLKHVHDQIGNAGTLLYADVTDVDSLRRVAASCTVLLTAVGPYSDYGEAVVRACIDEATHYADITGEMWWVAEMALKYEAAAFAKGVSIVSFAGYDCVPFELGTLLVNEQLKAGGTRLDSAECLTWIGGGGFPAGTMLTILSIATLGLQRTLPGWWRYIPTTERLGALRDVVLWSLPRWSSQQCGFTLAEGMGAVSCAIVHRSAPQLGYPGVRFQSRQALPLGSGASPLALLTLWGLLPIMAIYALLATTALPAVLAFLLVSLSPAAARLAGRLIPLLGYAGRRDVQVVVRTRGTALTGQMAHATLTFAGDPGIFLTAQCACETAIGMVEAAKGGAMPSGFITPVLALGNALAARLKKAGVQIDCA